MLLKNIEKESRTCAFIILATCVCVCVGVGGCVCVCVRARENPLPSIREMFAGAFPLPLPPISAGKFPGWASCVSYRPPV